MRVEVRPVSEQPGYVSVMPHGPIDTESHDDFRRVVEPVLADKQLKHLLIDLKDVEYISSAGLGVLFSVKKNLDRQGGELIFCHAQPQILKLFETVKFLPKESVFKSLDEADRYFYGIMNMEIEKRKKK